jgi:hypothetical protein
MWAVAQRLRQRRGPLALTLVALALAACEGASPPTPSTHTSLRGAVLLEPPLVAVGQVARVEIVVATPPTYHVHPLAPPEPLDGFWVIGVEVPTVEHGAGRWVHRMGVRIRAREVGTFEWPARNIVVEDADGGHHDVALDALALEVVSVFPEFPDRVTPFGLELPPATETPALPSALAAAAGAALALAGVAFVARVRRRRAAVVRQPPAARPPPEWDEARAALARARAEPEPAQAAALASAALRHFAARRFGTDSPVRTTEELAGGSVHGALGERFESFLGLLQRLDAAHFRGRPVEAADLAAALDAAEAFVQDATPEALR